MFEGTTLTVIGCGNMGEALVQGMLRQGVIEPGQIIAAEPRDERGRELVERYGIRTTTDNAEAAREADVLALAVKPQVIPKVLPGLRPVAHHARLILSICAGVSIRTISDGLANPNVVRAMPNTPGMIGQGISVWTATPEVPEPQIEQARAILSALGEEVLVDGEEYLDMATALSGTGPAYVLLFMEALIEAGVHLGCSRRISDQLVLQTMRGTVELASQQREKHAAALRNQVTSPGGTSAEAIYHLEKGGLRTVMSRAVWAAYQRSVALGGGEAKSRLGGRNPDKLEDLGD